MSRHPARPGRMIPVIGTSCGLLAAAAFIGGMRPTVTLPQAGEAGLTVAEDPAPAGTGTTGTGTTPFVGGPLQMPSIGVVAPGFDERYAALSTASHSTPVASPVRAAPSDVASQLQVPPTQQPPVSTSPASTSTSKLPDPTTPSAPASTSPPAPSSPSGTPPAGPAPTDQSPTDQPPTDQPPADPLPSEPPPSEPPPTEPPPSEPPPSEPPPTEEPPADVEVALGERYDVLGPSGKIAYTIVVREVVADLSCTAADSVPAENGHLVGVRLRVITGPDPAGKPQAFGPADFQVVGSDGTPVTDVDTESAAACLDEKDEFPTAPVGADQHVSGTIVLDVPKTSGTLAYRPSSGRTSLLWQF